MTRHPVQVSAKNENATGRSEDTLDSVCLRALLVKVYGSAKQSGMLSTLPDVKETISNHAQS